MPTSQPAGLAHRIAAFVIDQSLLGGVTIYGFYLLSQHAEQQQAVRDSGNGLLFGGIFIAWVLYFALLDSSAHRGTLGKLMLGLRIQRPNGEPVSFFLAALQYILTLGSAVIAGFIYASAVFISWAISDPTTKNPSLMWWLMTGVILCVVGYLAESGIKKLRRRHPKLDEPERIVIIRKS